MSRPRIYTDEDRIIRQRESHRRRRELLINLPPHLQSKLSGSHLHHCVAMDYIQIGAILGVTPQRARQICNVALNKLIVRLNAELLKYENETIIHTQPRTPKEHAQHSLIQSRFRADPVLASCH